MRTAIRNSSIPFSAIFSAALDQQHAQTEVSLRSLRLSGDKIRDRHSRAASVSPALSSAVARKNKARASSGLKLKRRAESLRPPRPNHLRHKALGRE